MKKWLFLIAMQSLTANPLSPLVVQGAPEFRSTGNLLEITAPHKNIIHWEEFSIGKDEITRFIQPDSTSAVLNRVTGNLTSIIDGILEANGRVILVNPNGIIVSPTGLIQAGDFVAATYDVLDLTDWSIKPPSSDLNLSGAINMEGIIHAPHLKEEKGMIFLAADEVNIQGEMRAANMEILGDRLEISSQATLDASSSYEGGSILIGNENTSSLNTEKGAILRVDATLNGNGGSIYMWGDSNAFQGKTSARGGPEGGNGGFVEISGNQLFYDGVADRSAPCGKGGLLYLDPTDVIIGAATSGGPTIGNPTTWTGPLPVNIMAAAIGTALDSGDVSINTSTPPALGGAGIILLLEGNTINWTMGTNSLTLIADSLIDIGGSITTSTAGNINLTAPTIQIGSTTNTMPTTLSTSGAITMNASSSMTIEGGMAGGVVVIETNANTAPININAGSLTVSSVTAMENITIGGNAAGPVIIDVAGDFSLENDFNNDVVINTNNYLDINVGQDLLIQTNGGNIIRIEANSATGNSSTIDVGGSLIADSPGTGAFAFSFMNSFLNLNAGADVSLTCSSNTPSQFGTLGMGGNMNIGGNFFISSSGTGAMQILSNSDLSMNVGGDFDLLNTGTSSTTIAAFGDLVIRGGGDLNIVNTSAPMNLVAAIAAHLLLDIEVAGSVTTDAGEILGGIPGPCDIIIVAGQDIIIGPNSAINPVTAFGGTLNSITLVVDNAFPSPPLLGPGAFYLDASSAIHDPGTIVSVQIFTSQRNLNTINGTINNASFSPGPFNVNTATEQWAQYYPQAFIGLPFTIFYKEPQLLPNVLSASTQTIGVVFDQISEFQVPILYFDDRFCISYEGDDFANGLIENPLFEQMNSVDVCPWIQIENYRKFYPSLQRWGYMNQE